VNDKSRMNREVHVRFRESLRVKLLRATRLKKSKQETREIEDASPHLPRFMLLKRKLGQRKDV